MPDGDEGGERFAESFLQQVAPHRFVRWGEAGKKPTDTSRDELNALLNTGGGA